MKILISVLILTFMLFSCNNKNKDEGKSKLGKYVYVDRDKCLHTNRNCIKFIIDEESVGGVIFVETEKLSDSCFVDFCPKCVDELQFEHIDKVLKRKMKLYRVEDL